MAADAADKNEKAKSRARAIADAAQTAGATTAVVAGKPGHGPRTSQDLPPEGTVPPGRFCNPTDLRPGCQPSPKR
jgi:hypothetical protein